MSSSPTTVSSIEILNSSEEMSSRERIVKFVESIDDILCNDEYDEELFVNMIKLTITNGYRFKSMEPMPNLADCTNILIRDQHEFPENSKMYHYYNAMVSWFVMICFKQINATPEHISMMEGKMKESIQNFKRN